jgi:hypothetical protein
MSNAYGEDNLIVWQKWSDPFGEDDINDNDTTLSHNDESDEEGEYQNLGMNSKPMKAIATPMGIIPYTENTASSKIFNFWVGHTNFDINQAVANIIESTDGVEALDVFTRYRFRIAIGKIFDDAKVMKEINDQVYQSTGS